MLVMIKWNIKIVLQGPRWDLRTIDANFWINSKNLQIKITFESKLIEQKQLLSDFLQIYWFGTAASKIQCTNTKEDNQH